MNELLESALEYARNGWPVFPCNPMPNTPSAKKKQAKAPLVGADRDKDLNPIPNSGGLYKATTDEAQIKAWWKKWPKALIGVPTGRKSGVFVVDLDPRGDETLADVEARLIDAVGELPPGLRSITQSGGAHYWFNLPEGEDTPRNAAKKLEAVDWRGDGGYVIVPPSVMLDGKAYTWAVGPDEGAPADAPSKLLDLIYQRGAFAKKVQSESSGRTGLFSGKTTSSAANSNEQVEKAVRSYLQAAIHNGAESVAKAAEGTRGSTLNSVAYSLGKYVATGEISEREVWAKLADAADASGMTSVDGDRERDAKIRRGLDAGAANVEEARANLARIRREASERASRFSKKRAPEPPPHDAIPDRGAEPDRSLEIVGGTDHGDAPPVQETPASNETIKACSELDTSDTDNAKRLLKHFGADLTVLAMDGSAGGDWMRWSGTHWDMTGGLAGAQECAKQIGDLIMLEAEHLMPTDQEQSVLDEAFSRGYDLKYLDRPYLTISDFAEPAKDAVRALRAFQKRLAARHSFGVSSKNAGRVENMLKMAVSEIRRPPEEFNPHSKLVVTKTHTLIFDEVLDPDCPDPDVDRYVIDIREVEGHRRDDWRTASVPVEWKGLDAPAPKWEKFLDRCLPDPDKRRTVQQVSGLGLLAMSLQKVMFHYGAGANGKSVFLETIARILGPGLMVGLPRESLIGAGERNVGSASPDLVRLYGKSMVRILEVPGDEPLQEDLIKRLTGGEPFPVRTLFKGYFEFQNVATPHMSGNGLPTISGTDNGIWRRMMLVHWDQIIPDEEQRDFEEMVSELVREDGPGILAWLVAGALDYLNSGLYIAENVKAETAAYHEEMDPIGEFWNACVIPAPGARLQASQLYTAYKNWSEANAKRARTNTKFGRTIKDRVKKVTISGRIYYEDIDLQNVPEPPTPLLEGGKNT